MNATYLVHRPENSDPNISLRSLCMSCSQPSCKNTLETSNSTCQSWGRPVKKRKYSVFRQLAGSCLQPFSLGKTCHVAAGCLSLACFRFSPPRDQ